jgi:hypothetical protein
MGNAKLKNGKGFEACGNAFSAGKPNLYFYIFPQLSGAAL